MLDCKQIIKNDYSSNVFNVPTLHFSKCPLISFLIILWTLYFVGHPLNSAIKKILIRYINGLQVNRGGGVDREFTKSLIIRDFDDVLENPFRYVDLFLLHTLLSKKCPKIAMQDL